MFFWDTHWCWLILLDAAWCCLIQCLEFGISYSKFHILKLTQNIVTKTIWSLLVELFGIVLLNSLHAVLCVSFFGHFKHKLTKVFWVFGLWPLSFLFGFWYFTQMWDQTIWWWWLRYLPQFCNTFCFVSYLVFQTEVVSNYLVIGGSAPWPSFALFLLQTWITWILYFTFHTDYLVHGDWALNHPFV